MGLVVLVLEKGALERRSVGRRYRGSFVLHCVQVLAGVPEWKVHIFMAVSWVGITTSVPYLTICTCTYLTYVGT